MLLATPPQVLVIDDNLELQELASAFIRKLGLVPEPCNPKEAIELLAQGPSNPLILLDIHMPGCNAVEFVDRLRALKDGIRRRILLLTGAHYAMIAMVENYIQAKGHEHVGTLRKPFSQADLSAALSAAHAEAPGIEDPRR